ncbi:Kinesin-like protein KIF15 [Hordeum vulgare]|nr:Kinesin-like protein KIF15 [Hordeum vulgare]
MEKVMSLLECFPCSETLHFQSSDTDYRSGADEYYTTVSDYIQQRYPIRRVSTCAAVHEDPVQDVWRSKMEVVVPTRGELALLIHDCRLPCLLLAMGAAHLAASKNRPVCTGNATTPAPPPALGRRALGQRSRRREGNATTPAPPPALGRRALGQRSGRREEPSMWLPPLSCSVKRRRPLLGSELGVKPGSECGMAPRIFQFLIGRIRTEEESRRDENLKYNCKCFFLEIYNEQITDLLDPSSTNLQLREDTRLGVYVENLNKREVTCVSDIITLLMQGSVNRKVSMTH